MCLQNVVCTVCVYRSHVYSMCLQKSCLQYVSTLYYVYSMSTECHVYNTCLHNVMSTVYLQNVMSTVRVYIMSFLQYVSTLYYVYRMSWRWDTATRAARSKGRYEIEPKGRNTYKADLGGWTSNICNAGTNFVAGCDLLRRYKQQPRWRCQQHRHGG